MRSRDKNNFARMRHNSSMLNIIATIVCLAMTISPISIDSYLSTNSMIKDSATLIADKTVIVALITQPIYTKSQRDKFMKDVAKDLAEQFKLYRVVVTLDGEVFCHIELSSSTPEKILEMISRRGGGVDYTK